MDLGQIKHVSMHTGPFVSVHLDVSQNTEDAAQQRDARWSGIRRDLEQAVVDPGLIEQLGQRARETTDVPGEARRTLIASEGDVIFDDVRAGHSMWPEETSYGPLPDLSGWLHQVDGQMPFVLVNADREGADLDVFQAISKASSEHREVHGATLHITKVPQGDWAQKQFQQRAENVWRHNAREVADAVRTASAATKPQVVVLAGDERARAEIASALDGLQVPVEQVKAGGRAAGASQEALWAEVRGVLAAVEANEQRDISERLLEKTGQGSGAARGLDDVLAALVQGKADRLVLDLQAAHDLTVTPADYPGLPVPETALDEKDLAADQVLVAAGAATDAQLSLLPTEQTKGAGVAALLRWDD